MSDVASLLPVSASAMERQAEQAAARLGALDVPLRTLWNPQTCPVNLLPWLAWSMSLDNWDTTWQEYIKRARIASAMDIQRHKGTVKAVKDTVASFGGSVDVTEWWQQTPRGRPHTFSMVLTLSGNDGDGATAAFVQSVLAEVDKVKPLRSQYTFTQGISLQQQQATAQYVRPLILVRLALTEDTD